MFNWSKKTYEVFHKLMLVQIQNKVERKSTVFFYEHLHLEFSQDS